MNHLFKSTITNMEKIKSTIKDRTVVTHDLSEAKASECRKIDGAYYKIGDVNVKNSGQCYIIKNWSDFSLETAIRAGNNMLIWCETRKQYCKKTGDHGFGFVNEKEKGWFLVNIDSVRYYTPDGVAEWAKNIDVVEKTCFYDPLTTVYKQGKMSQRDTIGLLRNTRTTKPRYASFSDAVYNFSDVDKHVLQQIATIHENYRKTLLDSEFDRFVGNKTVGYEIETSTGSIPEHKLYQLGVIPVRDGSITGHEFVTVIRTKNKFVHLMDEFLTLASNYTLSNEFCSLHFHFGNIPKTKPFVTALYHLYYCLQSELDELNPPYKRNTTYIASKREAKDHCKLMPNIHLKQCGVDAAFDKILKLCNDGIMPAKNENLYINQHAGRPKWEHHGRYFSINFLPLLFERKGTVEFRVPAGTVNKHKTAIWFFVFNAVVDFAIKHQDSINDPNNKEKINLSDVLNSIYCDGSKEGIFLYNYLMSYASERQYKYMDLVCQNNLFGDHFENDNVFEYNIEKRNIFNYK